VQQDGNGNYKNYTIAYVVYEKVADCVDYPPDGKVTFNNIKIYCNKKQIVPQWTTSFVEDVCNNRAHVINASTIQITWNTSGTNPSPAQKARNLIKPWNLPPSFQSKKALKHQHSQSDRLTTHI